MLQHATSVNFKKTSHFSLHFYDYFVEFNGVGEQFQQKMNVVFTSVSFQWKFY